MGQQLHLLEIIPNQAHDLMALAHASSQYGWLLAAALISYLYFLTTFFGGYSFYASN